MTVKSETVDVAIIGGGAVGLCTAIFLGQWGLKVAVFDRRDEPANHPRATLINIRTMELLRLVGIDEEVKKQGVPIERLAKITWASNLTSQEFGHLDIFESSAALMRSIAQSPALPALCAQDKFERILEQKASTMDTVQLHRGCEVTKLTSEGQDCGIYIDGQTTPFFRAAYGVLAEGVHGSLRETLGITQSTGSPIDRMLDIYFQADLSRWTEPSGSALYWILNAKVQGVIISVDPTHGEWLLEVPISKINDFEQNEMTTEAATRLIRSAIGVVVPISVRSFRWWDMGSSDVDRWSDVNSKVFLVGDCAHTFPPTGGFGMNTGIQDGHNLSWKIAGVILGWADNELLDSYEVERRPVAEFNGRQSEINADMMIKYFGRFSRQSYPVTSSDEKVEYTEEVVSTEDAIAMQRPHFDHQGQALGFRYGLSRPVVRDVVRYDPIVAPGARFPHKWLILKGVRQSTIDITDRSYALVVTPESADHWRVVTNEVRNISKIPIGVHLLEDLEEWSSIHCDAVLIRPDGHVMAVMTSTNRLEQLNDAIRSSNVQFVN